MIDATEHVIYPDDPVDWPKPVTVIPWAPYEIPWLQDSPFPGDMVCMRCTVKAEGDPDKHYYREMTDQERADYAGSK